MLRTTGLGSLGTTDMTGAVKFVFESDFPYLPELPGRGVGADLTGRAIAVLPLAASFDNGRWYLSDHPGLDQRRARAMLRDDLDRMQEVAHGYQGVLKVACCGPWTLSTTLDLPLGGRVLADAGAQRDVCQGFTTGVVELADQIQRRLPGTRLVVQCDEPALPLVGRGAIPTPGGYFRYPPVDDPELAQPLAYLVRHVAAAAGVQSTLVHCCAPGMPIGLLVGPEVGFDAVSVDTEQVQADDLDSLAALLEAGHDLYLGVVPTSRAAVPRVDEVVGRALGVLRPLGMDPTIIANLVLTPACGLAGFTPQQTRAVMNVLQRAATLVAEALTR